MNHHEWPHHESPLNGTVRPCAKRRQDRYTELGERESRELMHEERGFLETVGINWINRG